MQRASEAESCGSEDELQFPFCEEPGAPFCGGGRRPDNPLAAYLAAQGSLGAEAGSSFDNRGLPPRRKRKASNGGSMGNLGSLRRFCGDAGFGLQHEHEGGPFSNFPDNEEYSPEGDYSPASSFGVSPQLHFHPEYSLRLRPSSSSSIIAIEPRRPQQQAEETRLDGCSPLRQQLMNMQLATR